MNEPSVPALKRLQRLNSLLEQALALSKDEREAWLRARSPAEQTLVPLLAGLLERADDAGDPFLRESIDRTLLAAGVDGEPPPDEPGDTIGLGASLLRFSARKLAHGAQDYANMQHIPRQREKFRDTQA